MTWLAAREEGLLGLENRVGRGRGKKVGSSKAFPAHCAPPDKTSLLSNQTLTSISSLFRIDLVILADKFVEPMGSNPPKDGTSARRQDCEWVSKAPLRPFPSIWLACNSIGTWGVKTLCNSPAMDSSPIFPISYPPSLAPRFPPLLQACPPPIFHLLSKCLAEI